MRRNSTPKTRAKNGRKRTRRNSTPKTRAKNGRKRTRLAKIKVSGRGTKAKRAARAKARKAAKIKRYGATPPALRATKDTLPRFERDQKRRRFDRIGERFTAVMLSALKAAREGDMPPNPAPLSEPRTAPQKPERDRTKMRADGMRFGDGEWAYVDGTHGSVPQIGYGRVKTRRRLRQLMRGLDRDIEKLAEIGESVSRAAVGLGS